MKFVAIEQGEEGQAYVTHIETENLEEAYDTYQTMDSGNFIVITDEAWRKIENIKMKAIITWRLEKRNKTKEKVIGKCPLPMNKSFCTDVNGEHHSFLEEDVSLETIERKAKAKCKKLGGHLTRIEIVEE